MSGGLLVGGLIVPVPGLDVVNPVNGPDWCKLGPADYRQRKTSWVRQIILHTTKGIWPQHVKPGAGPHGREKVVADFWRGDPQHSGAQLVVGSDGKVACLCDLAKVAAYHATVSNDWSIGIEMYQESDGSVYEACLHATTTLVLALCDQFSIPLQVPGPYTGQPIARMLDGGPDCVGVFGHRDNTTRRGHGDPGDAIFTDLMFAGAERLDFDKRQDLSVWMRRQMFLNRHGARLSIDGIAGPSTIRAAKDQGYATGRAIDRGEEETARGGA